MSVTEGEDKPLKYPNMFAAADLLLPLGGPTPQDFAGFEVDRDQRRELAEAFNGMTANLERTVKSLVQSQAKLKAAQ